MKAEELRIGNYVLLPNGDVCKIVRSDFECRSGLANIEDYKPIPITEQWLIDFEFERRDSSVSADFHIGINPVTHDWLFDVVWIKDYKEDYALNGFPFYKNGHFEIKYVHQLQNLYFALTGQELQL